MIGLFGPELGHFTHRVRSAFSTFRNCEMRVDPNPHDFDFFALVGPGTLTILQILRTFDFLVGSQLVFQVANRWRSRYFCCSSSGCVPVRIAFFKIHLM